MHRWKLSALAAAAALSFGIYSSSAWALAFGRLTVQSALGEPLRAEIELPQITPEEADTLHVGPAAPEVFRAQGVEFSPLLNDMRITLRKRADGSVYLQVTSNRPINEPFLDLVIDASWNAGHLIRNYTILLDPPALRRPAPEIGAAAQVAPSSSDAGRTTAGVTSAPATPAAAGRSTTERAATRPRAAQAAPSPGSVTRITVRPGYTAARIAAAHRPASVSLDQMLVALLRSNPDAFIQGNVNRLRSGAVLQLPDEATAQSTPPNEARQLIAAQSRDFNNFRRKLASAATKTEIAPAQRFASGSVQTAVEDKKAAAASPDKLLLSKPSAPGQPSAEDQLAQEKQKHETAARVAELSQNIAELNKLSAASTGASAPASAAAPSSEPTPAGAAASSPQGLASGSVTASAGLAPAEQASVASAASVAAAASAPASRPKQPPVPAPQPEPQPGFVASLFEEPLLPAVGGLLALLLGYGAYRIARKRSSQKDFADSTIMESRLQRDSFFGSSGGQRVDTTQSDLSTGASSMAYSPSQLDAGGDIDPVAEADVYLAYGRDMQAEEILKEALRHHPERVSIHVKLAEIYAKRQDRKALEAVATEVFKLTHGEGPEWGRVADLGRALEPANPLYQPGGRPKTAEQESSAPGGFPNTLPGAAAVSSGALPELDLNLEEADVAGIAAPSPEPLTADSAQPQAPTPQAAAEMPQNSSGSGAEAQEATVSSTVSPTDSAPPPPSFAMPPAQEPGLAPQTLAQAPVQEKAPTEEPALAELDFSGADLHLPAQTPAPLEEEAPSSELPSLEFDLGDLSLELDSNTDSATTPAPLIATNGAPESTAQDPLATKLALAQEFHSIGDTEGARQLVEEVLAEASGPLKERAQRLLNEIG